MTDLVLRLWRDPAAINYLLMVLYVANVGRWSLERSWPDVWYWIGAVIITAAVTFRR